MTSKQEWEKVNSERKRKRKFLQHVKIKKKKTELNDTIYAVARMVTAKFKKTLNSKNNKPAWEIGIEMQISK